MNSRLNSVFLGTLPEWALVALFIALAAVFSGCESSAKGATAPKPPAICYNGICLPEDGDIPGFPDIPEGGYPAPATYGVSEGTADWKILKAVEDGELTMDEAWVRRMEARFNPSALPPEFQPDAIPGAPENEKPRDLNPQFVSAAMEALPTLGLAAQQAIIPYLLPPSSPESFWNEPKSADRSASAPMAHGISKERVEQLRAEIRARGARDAEAALQRALMREAGCPGYAPIPEPFPNGQWVYADDSFFRFWYRKGSFSDNGLQIGMQRMRQSLYIAKNRYTELMGTNILDDTGQHAFVAQDGSAHVWCDGGNGKLDIYLAPISDALGLTVTYPVGCNQKPSFIVVDPHRPYWSDKSAEFIIAHELFHVFQFTKERRLACKEYVDADEGIANWAAHWVFPDNNGEHDYDVFTRHPEDSLIGADYDSWPFFYGMVQKYGTRIIPQFYTASAGLNPYRALKSVLPGGFRKNWPEFSVLGWNQLPGHPSFKEWDGFDKAPQVDYKDILVEMKLDARGEFHHEKLYPLPMGLTRAYERFRIPAAARSLTLSWSTGGVDEEDFHVRAMIKRGGQWKIEDWDAKPDSKRPHSRRFCFDDPQDEGRIEDIVLAFSRSDIEAPWGEWTDATKFRLTAGANNMPCYAIQGTATVKRSTESGDPTGYPYEKRDYEAVYRAEFRAKRDDDGELTTNWEYVEGSASFSYRKLHRDYDPCASEDNPSRCRSILGEGLERGAVITCTGSASGAFGIREQFSYFHLDPYTTSSGNERDYGISLAPGDPVDFEVGIVCSDGTNSTDRERQIGFQQGFVDRPKVDPQGRLKGSGFSPSGEAIVWDFGAKP